MRVHALTLALFFATIVSVEARIGETGEDAHGRRLCKENNDGCFSVFNPCCDGSSCHVDRKCYPYPRQENDGCIPALDQCADGLTCDMTRMKCRAEGTQAGDKCNFSRPCAEGSGLACDLLTSKCRVPGSEGQKCHASKPCAEGLVCESVNLVCRAAGLENAPCSLTRSCAEGLSCDLTSTVCRGKSSLGGACHLSRFCEDDLYCDLEKQTCRVPLAEGKTCSRYVPCAKGLDCDSNSNTCAVTPSKCEVEGGEGCGDVGTAPPTDPVDVDLDNEPGPCPLTNPGCQDNETSGGGGNPGQPNGDNNEGDTGSNGDPDDKTGADGGEVDDKMPCVFNMATGDCTPETRAPTVSPTTARPTRAPTTRAPSTQRPTQGSTEKCALTGCVGMDATKVGDDYEKIPVETAAPNNGGRRLLEADTPATTTDSLLSDYLLR